MKKIMVFGTFDVLHKGHLNFFSQAKKHGDYLIAVVARDKTVKEVKGIFPRHNEKKRLVEVKKHVDKAVLGYIRDKYKVISKFKPDIICLGYDQRSFINGLKRFKIPIKRLKAYMTHKYKSSKIKKQ
ncbi:adenylyltransferase/cytidyltransferase family protein [Candidatus Woesearchaeota archaeon]|nr:adenylyltransferase/cytidyltransferase family protein [Candidatus Woesearchaeota archaeon]